MGDVVGRPKGKRTRRIIKDAIKNGLLDTWTSSRDLLIKIQEGYDESKGTRGYNGGMVKRETRYTVMEIATNLAILERYGLVEMKRARRNESALWRAKPEP